ncbi:MAG: DUF3106 domain-containing protein [Terriglobales bacterium]
MLGRTQILGCAAALLLLTPVFAQNRPHPQSKNADGQWHHFQQGGGANRPAANRPANRGNEAHPPNQPGHAGAWLRRYKDLPAAQQRRALESDPQFRRLPPQQQRQLQNRLQHFSSLPPQQQERMLGRMETWEHLTPGQKQQAHQLFQQFRQLPPQRRQAVNSAIRGMRDLNPAQRDRLINSEQYRREFSPQERGMLESAAHLPLAPGGLQ